MIQFFFSRLPDTFGLPMVCLFARIFQEFYTIRESWKVWFVKVVRVFLSRINGGGSKTYTVYIYEWKYISAWSGSGYFGPRDFLPPIRAPVPFAVSLFLFRRSRIIGVSALPRDIFGPVWTVSHWVPKGWESFLSFFFFFLLFFPRTRRKHVYLSRIRYRVFFVCKIYGFLILVSR